MWGAPFSPSSTTISLSVKAPRSTLSLKILSFFFLPTSVLDMSGYWFR